jgi:translation elongation factor EF-G
VIESEDFAGDVTLRVRVPVEEVTGVRGALRNLSGGRTDLTEVDH